MCRPSCNFYTIADMLHNAHRGKQTLRHPRIARSLVVHILSRAPTRGLARLKLLERQDGRLLRLLFTGHSA